jgi:hypothetical protein
VESWLRVLMGIIEFVPSNAWVHREREREMRKRLFSEIISLPYKASLGRARKESSEVAPVLRPELLGIKLWRRDV